MKTIILSDKTPGGLTEQVNKFLETKPTQAKDIAKLCQYSTCLDRSSGSVYQITYSVMIWYYDHNK